ncbi:MAG: ARMT1-like domain-containing protein [Anaerolineae bacterium]
MFSRPDPIRTNDNAFAHRSMQARVPAILREMVRLNADLPAETLDQLHLLAIGMENDAPIPMIRYPAPDYADWRSAYLAHDGDTWLNSEWFFAETFVYRHLIEIVDWFRQGRDPFLPHKQAHYEGSAVWTTLEAALEVRENDRRADEKLHTLLHLDLWGNSIDLSHPVAAAHGTSRTGEDLLVDQSGALVNYLVDLRPPFQVDLMLDNAGTELALDLALVDLLLDDWAFSVVLHVKQHPTFVSDVVRGDILDFLALLRARKETPLRALGDRLSAAVQEGAITIRPDWFWNSSRFLWEKHDLARLLEGSRLLIAKGDMNYRRMVGDALWEPTTPFNRVVEYVPVPVAALRTLKSDTIVGLRAGTAERLQRTDPDWRFNGKRGVFAFKR